MIDEFDPIYWCLHCGRTYKKGEIRARMVLRYRMQLCAYSDCRGSVAVDGLEWVSVREANPQYPKVPTRGVVYEYPGGR